MTVSGNEGCSWFGRGWFSPQNESSDSERNLRVFKNTRIMSVGVVLDPAVNGSILFIVQSVVWWLGIHSSGSFGIRTNSSANFLFFFHLAGSPIPYFNIILQLIIESVYIFCN